MLLLIRLLEKEESDGVAVEATAATDNVSKREGERGRPPPCPGTAEDGGDSPQPCCLLLPVSLQGRASMSP